MNKKIRLGIIIALVFGVGFFAGMEYKAYEIRSAFEQAFEGSTDTSVDTASADTVQEKVKKENLTIIKKSVGDEIALATLKLKVDSSEETQTISSSYSTPKVAKEGTKFVVINLDVTNITKSAFTFYPDDGLILVDNKDREFSTYSESIGIDEDLSYEELSPSVVKSGILVYEVPSDATNYSLFTGKKGTKDLYKIVLK